jgi:hypothetical protein
MTTRCPINETSIQLIFKDEARVGLGTITIDQESDQLYIDKSLGKAGLFQVYINCTTVGGVSG